MGLCPNVNIVNQLQYEIAIYYNIYLSSSFAMNSIQPLRLLASRAVSGSARRGLTEQERINALPIAPCFTKHKERQRAYQSQPDEPVHLRGGMKDRMKTGLAFGGVFLLTIKAYIDGWNHFILPKKK